MLRSWNGSRILVMAEAVLCKHWRSFSSKIFPLWSASLGSWLFFVHSKRTTTIIENSYFLIKMKAIIQWITFCSSGMTFVWSTCVKLISHFTIWDHMRFIFLRTPFLLRQRWLIERNFAWTIFRIPSGGSLIML